MSKKAAVPDAWDDDWIDNAHKSEPQPANVPAKLSKAERRAQHVERQKQLWDTAENPARNMWLESQGVVPLKQDFKPPVTLLSRKPPTIAKRDPSTGLANLSLGDDGDDSEEEARKKREADFEERQRKAKLDREEKQRKYAEARERIMGSPAPSTSANVSRESSQGNDNKRNKAKSAGSRNRPSASASGSPASHSPARQNQQDSKLFDPDDMGRRLPRRETPTVPPEDQPVRQPRGPDTAGRGGFGFAGRGGSSSMPV